MLGHRFKSRLSLPAGLLACAIVSHSQQPKQVPVVTVCEALRSLDLYRGKSVVLIGNTGWTFEGSFMHEQCEPDGRMSIHGQRWLSMVEVRAATGPENVNSSRAFPVAEGVLRQKLAQVRGYTPENAGNVWGNWEAVFGTIESPVRLQQKPVVKRGTGSDGSYLGNGYGANGTVPAMIQSMQTITLVRGHNLEVKQNVAIPEMLEPPPVSPLKR